MCATDGNNPPIARLGKASKAVGALRQDTAGMERRLREQIAEMGKQHRVGIWIARARNSRRVTVPGSGSGRASLPFRRGVMPRH
jgi:hypothetical protein